MQMKSKNSRLDSIKMIISSKEIGSQGELLAELEKEGFIYTIAAKGCFVAPLNTDLLRETNLKKIEDYMEKIVHLAASCNLSEQELTEMLHFMMEE